MCTVALLLLAGLALTAQAAPAPYLKKDTSQADLKKMQGAWHRVWVTILGRRMRPDAPLADEAVIAGDRMTYKVRGAVNSEWAITLDPRRRPKVFDVRELGSGSPTPPAVYRGVYALEGDTLVVCYILSADEALRPKSVSSSHRSHIIEVFKRCKKP